MDMDSDESKEITTDVDFGPDKVEIVPETRVNDFLEVDLQSVSPEERKAQVRKAGKTTLLQRAVITSERTLGMLQDNSDMSLASIAALFMAAAGAFWQRGEWLNSGIFFVLSVVLSLVKSRLPQGSMAQALRKPVGEIAANVKKTLHYRR